MNGYGVLPVPIRFYVEGDKEQVEAFRCSHYSPKWHTRPQKMIRRAPSLLENSPYEILIAHDGPEVVGVAVFEFTEEPSCYVWTLGVKRERQNEGIGKSLKRAVMVVSADRYPGLSVESQVHRNNTYMRQINSGLFAETEPLREDPDYLTTVVKAEVFPDNSDVTPSK